MKTKRLLIFVALFIILIILLQNLHYVSIIIFNKCISISQLLYSLILLLLGFLFGLFFNKKSVKTNNKNEDMY